MRIEYTSYKFRKPDIINHDEYLIIKNKLSLDPDFNPFKIQSFYSKFKVEILIYFIGIPISLGFLATENVFFSFIGGGFMFFAFFALFSLVPEWLSYLTFIGRFKFYHYKLLKKILKSSDYDHFKTLVR